MNLLLRENICQRRLEKAKKVYGGVSYRMVSLVILVEKVGDDTAISRIVKLLEEAQEKKAPIQNMADHLAKKWFLFPFGLALLPLY